MVKTPKATDLKELIQLAQDWTGLTLPKPVLLILGIFIFLIVVLALIYAALFGIAKIKDIWIEKLLPKTYKPEQRGRAKARKQFAKYLVSEIERLNRSENWRDEEFSELEAEVEASGRRRSWLPFKRQTGIAREQSLTKALARSDERLVLVEGDPGAGKSVSLRHVVHHLGSKAAQSNTVKSILPVYVNLKELKRDLNQDINRELIKTFVISTIRRVNDRFIDEFIDREFDAGIREGHWYFLFDSFDEIPDILSSTENDDTIRSYSEAISDFFGGVNACRGVVGSRAYRGPAAVGWTAFRILPLSLSRQRDLIAKSLVTAPAQATAVEGGLMSASDDVRLMARNPMLLGLLCEHVALGNNFPDTAFEVFAKYIEYRFERDRERVDTRFSIDVDLIRRIAEDIAYCMTADDSIGLSPTISDLLTATSTQNVALREADLRTALSALTYMRLGRLEGTQAENESEQFSFAHRRFQEYFATLVVIRGKRAVDPSKLLLDGRWRETAVVLLQTGSADSISPVLSETMKIIDGHLKRLHGARGSNAAEFDWGRGLLHILGILQSGVTGRAGRLPMNLREAIGELLVAASVEGNLLDKKLALEVAGSAPQSVLIRVMEDALAERSQWLSDVVYQQAARLAAPAPEIYAAIRTYISGLLLGHGIRRDYGATKAYLSRLPESGAFLSFLSLARVAAAIEDLAFPILVLIFFAISEQPMVLVFIPLLLYWASQFVLRLSRNLIVTGVALYVRIIAVLAPAIIVATELYAVEPSFASWTTLELVICFAGIVWAAYYMFAAARCIEYGIMGAWYFWPIVPIGMLYVLKRKVLDQLSLRELAVNYLMPGLWAGGSFALYIWLGNSDLLERVIEVFMPVFMVLLAGFVGGPVFANFLGDARRLRQWRSVDDSLATPERVVDAFRGMRTAWGEIATLRRLEDTSFEQESRAWACAFREMIRLIDLEVEAGVGWQRIFERRAYELQRTLERSSIADSRDKLFGFLERATRNERTI